MIARVPVGAPNGGLAITPDGTRVYVTNGFSDSVSVIGTATNTVVATITGAGRFPDGVAITPDGTRAYVAGASSESVSVIDTASNLVVAFVPHLFRRARQLAITPDGARVYVVNDGSVGTVSVVATASNTVVDTVNVGAFPFGIAITPTPEVPFSAFDAKVEIELGPLVNDDEFEVKGTFTLGISSTGLDIPTEIVSLQLTGGTGTFSTTIPAGSFQFVPAKLDKKPKPAHFKFEGVIDGVSLEAKITPLGGDTFEFKAEAEGAELTGIANPVTVTLTVGDDGGSTNVEAEFE